ncbi:MAG TPA: hypothetical protein VNK95_15995 [Caldilineaceae bacterium]|nr:hypothetical protein [Caldilineaceae bacterium]
MGAAPVRAGAARQVVRWRKTTVAYFCRSGDTARYPFHPRAVYRPGADRLSPDPLADYIGSLDARGVDRAVLVQPEPYGDDHRLVE